MPEEIIPRQYEVYGDRADRPNATLGAPVLRSLGAEPGDTLLVEGTTEEIRVRLQDDDAR